MAEHGRQPAPPASAYCRTCGSDWVAGDFDLSCAECGGGSLLRRCPACGGLCGAAWDRGIADSNDAGTAHWRGACRVRDHADLIRRLGEARPEFEWWLDEAALPDLYWACLVRQPNGRAAVVDMDRRLHQFPSYDLAHDWLKQDEYEPCLTLIEIGRIDPSTAPPLDQVDRLERLAFARRQP